MAVEIAPGFLGAGVLKRFLRFRPAVFRGVLIGMRAFLVAGLLFSEPVEVGDLAGVNVAKTMGRESTEGSFGAKQAVTNKRNSNGLKPINLFNII